MSRQSKRRFEMRCCVPLCRNDAENLPKPDDVSFHMFPESSELRQFWLDALDLNDLFGRDEKAVLNAVVCSEHFASADLYNTKSGFRKLRVGAVPLVIQDSLEDEEIQYEERMRHEDIEQLQICRICLETDTKLYSMGQYKFVEAYENLTGFMMCDDERLSRTLCPECTQRLINHDKFREKSLKAELLLTDLLKKTDLTINDEELKKERKKFGLTSSLVKQIINYNPYDLFIQEDTEFENDEANGNIKEDKINSQVYMERLTVLQNSRAKINTNKQTITPKPSVIQNTNSLNRSGSCVTPQKLARIAPKPNITPATKYLNTKIHKNVEKHNEPNQTAKVYQQTYKNVPAIENEVIVKQEVDPDNIEQCVQVDYIPVIDVVIDNKFKIVRKEELLLENRQLIIGNKGSMPIVREFEMNQAVTKNSNNTPIGLDRNVVNKLKGMNSNQKNEAVQRNSQNRNRNAKQNQTLPVIKGDRIIMPDDDTSILQNILSDRSPVHKKPTTAPQKSGDTYLNKPKSINPDNSKKDIQAIDKEAVDMNHEVPLINYDDQEYYEESVVETVADDYLDSQSDDDSEFNNIKRHVAKIMRSQKNASLASNTDTAVEETYASIHIPDTEVTEGNDENNEAWDVNNEENDDNDENWEQDDYSEDQDEDNVQNSDEAENDYNYIINERVDSEAVKRTKMGRKRKSVLLNYGKTYFYDDLNDVIFTIQQLSIEEQLVEIRKRLHTTYKDTTYTCDLCFRGFMHKYAYDRHMSLHTSNDGDFECAVCRFKFRSAKLLEAHQAARHATKFSCNLCDFTTTAHDPARLHGMKHRGIKYQCPHCSEEGIRYTVLMDHIAIIHSPECLCTVCGLKLLNDEDLERHKEVRHNNDIVRWDNATHCDTCDILFASEDAYRLHLGVSIKHDSEFIGQHLRAKSNEEEEFIKCPSQYKKPEITRPLTCEQCGIKLPTLRKYHAHFRRDHPDKTRTFYPTMKKKVMCELCGRFFKAQWQYVEHLRLHTNERPFSCEHCGKTFITNRLLCAHRYVHGVGRARPDIKCKLCGKTFANKGNLHRHMGVHTDEKRFKCEICNTAYRQKAEMKSHYEHVHLRKPWPKRHRIKRDDGRSKSLVTSEDDSSQTFKEEIVEEMEIEY